MATWKITDVKTVIYKNLQLHEPHKYGEGGVNSTASEG
jgi:hypothetical protein